MSHPITISPNIHRGEPVFSNTGVPVKNLFDYLKAGHPLNDFLEDFPSVKKEQAIEVIKLYDKTEEIKIYNKAMKRKHQFIPFDKAVKELKSKRK